VADPHPVGFLGRPLPVAEDELPALLALPRDPDRRDVVLPAHGSENRLLQGCPAAEGGVRLDRPAGPAVEALEVGGVGLDEGGGLFRLEPLVPTARDEEPEGQPEHAKDTKRPRCDLTCRRWRLGRGATRHGARGAQKVKPT